MTRVNCCVSAIGSRVLFENGVEKTPFLQAGRAYRIGALTGETTRRRARGDREPKAIGKIDETAL